MYESSDVLDQSRREARLSHGALWDRYFELGGRRTPMEVEAFLYGALVPTSQDRDLIVEALNERFSELGRGQPIPYSDG
jgi:hypothetical protein